VEDTENDHIEHANLINDLRESANLINDDHCILNIGNDYQNKPIHSGFKAKKDERALYSIHKLTNSNRFKPMLKCETGR
jgi:hypothetical protein